MKVQIEIDEKTLNKAMAAFVLAGAEDCSVKCFEAITDKLSRSKRPIPLVFDDSLEEGAVEKLKLSVAIALVMTHYPKKKE